MKQLYRESPFRFLLASAVVIGWFSVVLLFFVTSKSVTLNNKVHELFPYWPKLETRELTSDTVFVSSEEFPQAKAQRIFLTSSAQNFTVKDGGVSPLAVTAAYYRSMDAPLLTKVMEGDLLQIKLTKVPPTIDLPLQPYPIAEYSATVGNFSLPTTFEFQGETGENHISFTNGKERANIVSLSTDHGKLYASFTTEALPTERVIGKTEAGDMELILPGVTLVISYDVGEDGTLEIDEKTQYKGEKGTLRVGSGSRELPVEIWTERGDIFILTKAPEKKPATTEKE